MKALLTLAPLLIYQRSSIIHQFDGSNHDVKANQVILTTQACAIHRPNVTWHALEVADAICIAEIAVKVHVLH